ncbi:MAG: glycoside hydrolase family 5 protein [Pseudomonadota bacterium]
MIRKFLFALLLIAGASHRAEAADHAFRRGINILGYDPYWTDQSKRRFQWRHFRKIRSAGFDFVRVNLSAFDRMDSANRIDPAWLAKLDSVVREATKAGLGVVLDQHDWKYCDTDPAICEAKVSAFWSQVAARYARAPRSVAFELLNEPHGKLDAPAWNKLMPRLLRVIRQSNPARLVVVGPTSWNSLRALPQLELPTDSNLIVTFHYYEPMTFTHQGAPWVTQFTPLHGITWGSAADQAALRADFDTVAAWARAHHQHRILLGEFGAYDKSGTPMALRSSYTAAAREQAERHGFGWSYWQFDGDFVVWDMDKQRWVDPIRRALIP